MKSSQEILERLIENIDAIVKSPRMWFTTPESMELHILFITDLISFICGHPEGQYSDYLVAKGYEANTFTNSMKNNIHNDTDELFALYIEFFQEFYGEFKSRLSQQE